VIKAARHELDDFYRGRAVLVTGGASFIGSHLTELLLRAGARVTVADDLSSGSLENLSVVFQDIRFLRGDLRFPEMARQAARGQEIVFHLAANHGGRGYIDAPGRVRQQHAARPHSVRGRGS
jgi:nucleoside-diphosphate-sugar epimerase